MVTQAQAISGPKMTTKLNHLVSYIRSESAFEAKVNLGKPSPDTDAKTLMNSICEITKAFARTGNADEILGSGYKTTHPFMLCKGVYSAHFNTLSLRYHESDGTLLIGVTNPIAVPFARTLIERLKTTNFY